MASDASYPKKHSWVPWVRWQNFRGFRDTGPVDLKPLTILLGPNSSGKSSFYKPLLLMQQTVGSHRVRPGLVTRGELVNAGAFEDLVPLGDCDTKVRFEIGFHTHEARADLDPVGTFPPGRLDLIFGCEEDTHDVLLEQHDIFDIYGRRMVRRRRLDSGKYSLRLYTENRSEKPISEYDTRLRKELRAQPPCHFLFPASSAFTRATRPQDSEKPSQSDDIEFSFSDYSMDCVRALDYVDEHVTGLVRSFKYVGPLRAAPKRAYELSGEAPRHVGMSGEFAPEVFARAGAESELGMAIRASLREFGFVDDLASEEIAPGLFRLGVVRDKWNRSINIADLGFGVSQILPIVVQGLMLGRDEYLLAEQPEIHLNPALQSKLASFFAQIVQRGSRVMVETHSEHLLLALRRCVAAEKIHPGDVGIYFVEMVDGESQLRQIPIDDLGHIDSEDWPSGFFEDALAQAFALSETQARRMANAN